MLSVACCLWHASAVCGMLSVACQCCLWHAVCGMPGGFRCGGCNVCRCMGFV